MRSVPEDDVIHRTIDHALQFGYRLIGKMIYSECEFFMAQSFQCHLELLMDITECMSNRLDLKKKRSGMQWYSFDNLKFVKILSKNDNNNYLFCKEHVWSLTLGLNPLTSKIVWR